MFSRFLRIFAAKAVLILGILVLISIPAQASYDQKVVLTGSATALDAIPSGGVSFETADGEKGLLKVKEEDDEVFLWLRFSGKRGADGGGQAATLILGGGATPGTRIELPAAGPGEEIVVDVDRGTATTRPMPGSSYSDKPSWRPLGSVISVGGGVSTADVIPVSAGTRINSGGEFGVAFGSVDVGYTDWSGRYEYNTGDSIYGRSGSQNLTYYLDLGSGSGDDRTQGSVPIGGEDVGIVYPTWIALSTGVFLGPSGLDAHTDLDYDSLRVGGGIQWDCSKSKWFEKMTFSPRLGLWYESTEQKHQSYVNSPSFGTDIFQQTEQGLEQTNFSLEIGADFYKPLNDDWALIFGAGLRPYYYDIDLDSQHVGACVPCVDPAQQSYTIGIDQTESGWGFGGRAAIGLRWRATDSLSLDLTTDYTYRGDVGGIFNPVSGDDLFVDNRETEIVTEDLDETRVRLDFRFSF